jgi:hypothetical protein
MRHKNIADACRRGEMETYTLEEVKARYAAD